MAVLSVVVGVLLIALGLLDVFRTLLRPTGRGPVTRVVGGAAWGLGRRMGSPASSYAGPAGVVAAIFAWVVIVVAGFALVYLPQAPAGFTYSSGIDPHAYPPLMEAMTVSLVSFTTVGYGAAVAVVPVLRVVQPLEALTGFAVLTAAVSWFFQLYSSLARRRSLAARLAMLERAPAPGMIADDDPSSAVQVLIGLGGDAAQLAVDLQQNAEVYTFRERDEDLTLAMLLTRLERVAQQARAAESATVRRQGVVLGESVDRIAAQVREQIGVRGGDTAEIIDAVRRDYRVTVPAEHG